MNYLFKYHGKEMDVDATPRGLFSWWTLKRFFIGMYIAGWSWEKKMDKNLGVDLQCDSEQFDDNMSQGIMIGFIMFVLVIILTIIIIVLGDKL